MNGFWVGRRVEVKPECVTGYSRMKENDGGCGTIVAELGNGWVRVKLDKIKTSMALLYRTNELILLEKGGGQAMDNLKEAHRIMQQNCGINIGDTVRVVRKAKSGEMGWTATWVEDMDERVGKQGVVGNIYNSEDTLGIAILHYNFPFFALEKVEPVKPVTARDKVMSLLADSDLGCGKENIIEAVGLVMDEVEGKK